MSFLSVKPSAPHDLGDETLAQPLPVDESRDEVRDAGSDPAMRAEGRTHLNEHSSYEFCPPDAVAHDAQFIGRDQGFASLDHACTYTPRTRTVQAGSILRPGAPGFCEG